MGVDLNTAQPQLLDGVIELFDRQAGVLQGNCAQSDQAVRVGGRQLGHALIDVACQLGAKGRLCKIIVLKWGRRHSLNVDAHAVHVLNTHRHVRQHGCAVAHLLGIGFPRQLVGKNVSDLLLNRF